MCSGKGAAQQAAAGRRRVHPGECIIRHKMHRPNENAEVKLKVELEILYSTDNAFFKAMHCNLQFLCESEKVA